MKVLTLDQTGEILSPPDEKGDMQVQVGVMKIYVNIKDLMLIQGGPEGVNQPKKSKYERRTGSKGGEIFRTKAMTVSSSVNVVGKNLDDAEEIVLKYLDDCYAGGLKEETYAQTIVRKPTFPMEHAIKGMLPRGPLGRKLFTNLKVYADAKHPHAAQKPVQVEI